MSAADYTSPTGRIKTALNGSVLYLTFNNPARRNAMSIDMWEAVPDLLGRAGNDDDVRAVVFKGEGEQAFVCGADISQFEDLRSGAEAVQRYEQLAEDALMGIYRFPKPTVAAVHGFCIGGA